MRHACTGFLLGGAIAALVVSGFVGGRAIGQGTPKGPTVAVIDLQRVLDGLDQRADADRRVRSLYEEARTEDGEWQKLLERLRTELTAARDAGPSDAERVRRLEEQAVEMALRYEAWKQYSKERVDNETSLLMRDIYRAIREDLAAMGQVTGFEIVVRDDQLREIGVDPTVKASQEAQVMQQISAASILYVAPSIDVTDQLIARMNNAWKTGQRGAQPSPTLKVPDVRALPDR